MAAPKKKTMKAIHESAIITAVDPIGCSNDQIEMILLCEANRFIESCQTALSGEYVCGVEGCYIERREMRPSESAAFDAACDMLSRAFDSGWKIGGNGTGKPPALEME